MDVFNDDFEEYKSMGKYKGINYEIGLILTDIYENFSDFSRYHCVFVNKNDQKYIPNELKNKALTFDVSNESQKLKLLTSLKKPSSNEDESVHNTEQISHIKEDYHPEFIEFINRKEVSNDLLENGINISSSETLLLQNSKKVNFIY